MDKVQIAEVATRQALLDENARLREEIEIDNKLIEIDNKLLDARNELLEAIPACPEHGNQCIPHALEWVRENEDLNAQITALKQKVANLVCELQDTKP